MAKIILILAIMMFSNITFAMQIKYLNDNGSVLVKVSSKEESRIFVYKDRILAVRGVDGAYEIKKDETQGDIYIQPTPLFQHKPFNLFITTEQSRTYNLLVTPLDITAETIEIKPLSPSHRVAERWEKNSPYSQTLINLTNAMVNQSNPGGYAVINIRNNKSHRVFDCISMQLKTIYRGNNLVGEIWLIKNEGKEGTGLSPGYFYKNKVLSVSLKSEELAPGAETLLYRVVANDY